MSQEHHPYMPSSNALRSRIKRVKRAEMPAQPQTIEEINVPDSLLMDGTFKTVLTVFCELYTIHAPIGGVNSRILPLVYSLIISKSEEIYKNLFEELIEFAAENDIILQPSTILTDFELASINASRQIFPNIENKKCFFI